MTDNHSNNSKNGRAPCEVAQSMFDETKDYRESFDYLLGHKDRVCKIQSVVDNKIFFVDKKNANDCPYFLPYGKTGCCQSTLRKELYRRYGV